MNELVLARVGQEGRAGGRAGKVAGAGHAHGENRKEKHAQPSNHALPQNEERRPERGIKYGKQEKMGIYSKTNQKKGVRGKEEVA